MDTQERTTLLKGAHVVDVSGGMDGVADILIGRDKIVAVGDWLDTESDMEIVDLSGCYLTPGWIDIHVHALGTLGFGDPDSIGVKQGVTSFVDAGGPGILTLDEFEALSRNRLVTDLYAGPYYLPMGIVGFDYEPSDQDIADIREIPTSVWSKWIDDHPGVIRYVKTAAYSQRGKAPIEVARKVATELGLPLYLHIGENKLWPGLADPFEFALQSLGPGDIVTHMYNGCPQGRIQDRTGRILSCVQEAVGRGVLFDVGFGSYGFAWDVAEKSFNQGLCPSFISSDLQQFNVAGPTFSLANIMSICLHLGMSFQDVLACVTANPAKHLSLTDRAGSLRPGLPADLTVFRLESGRFELEDCVKKTRVVDRRFIPTMVFKGGKRIDCDLGEALDERNWFMQLADDHIPNAVAGLSSQQLAFVRGLAEALADVHWTLESPQRPDVRKAVELKKIVDDVRRKQSLSWTDALNSIYDCFLDNRFPMQIGLFLLRLERPFALDRLTEIARRWAMAEA